jgi:homoserine dehydrogenase
MDYKSCSNRFFVRTKSSKEEIAAVFGNVTYIENVVADEIGFTTEEMTEGEFEEKASRISVIHRLRLG